MKRQIGLEILLLAGICLLPQFSRAAVVIFNDADRGPSNALHMNGVTVTAMNPGNPGPPGIPSTTTGLGLGSGFIGPNHTVDGRYHYTPGQQWPENPGLGSTEGLRLVADGNISSFTVIPTFPVVVETQESVEAAIGISYVVAGAYFEVLIDPGAPGALTIPVNRPFWLGDSPVNEISIFNGYSMGGFSGGQMFLFEPWRQGHLNEEQTVQWGFSIVSVDFTPVPEPDVFGISMMGVLCAILWHRSRKECRRIN